MRGSNNDYRRTKYCSNNKSEPLGLVSHTNDVSMWI